MAGLDPLLSGTSVAYCQHQLAGRLCTRVWRPVCWIEQLGDEPAHEEMSAEDQQYVGGRVLAGRVSLHQAEQNVGDEGHGDLAADGILAGAHEAGDLQVLLDPLEERLDLPALFVECGDLLPGAGQVVGEQPQDLAGVGAVNRLRFIRPFLLRVADST